MQSVLSFSKPGALGGVSAQSEAAPYSTASDVKRGRNSVFVREGLRIAYPLNVSLLALCIGIVGCGGGGGGMDGSGSDRDGGSITTDQYVRADLVMSDGTRLRYDAPSTLAGNACSGDLDLGDETSVEGRFQIRIRWDASTMPVPGTYPTGNEAGLMFTFFGNGVGGPYGVFDVGSPDFENPNSNIVSLTEFGDIVSGTFEGFSTVSSWPSRIENGTFRCLNR